MQAETNQDHFIDNRQVKTIAELPNDREHRILSWFGHIVIDVEKNEPKLQLIFAKFDPEIEDLDGLFGGTEFYRAHNRGAKNRNDFFETYVVGIELIVFLKLGSIWRGQQEVGRILSTRKGSFAMTFDHIPAAIVSNPSANILTFENVFGTNDGYFVLPDQLKATYLYSVKYKIKNNYDFEVDIHLLFPLTEVFRKFYCQSSFSVFGIVTGLFTNLEQAPFERSDRGIEIEDGQRVAHINFFSPQLGLAEATLVSMLLYSKPALEGARLITDSLESSIKTGPGIISSIKFPFDEGTVSIEARYKRVKVDNNTWAFLILEIIKCSGQRAFDVVSPHTPYRRKTQEGNGKSVKFPPYIKFRNIKEAGFFGLDSSLIANAKMQRILLKVDEDLTSGYGGIAVLKSKELPKGFKSQKLNLYKDMDLGKLATGFGDKNGKSEVAGTNICGPTNKPPKRNNDKKGELIEVYSLIFFKEAIKKLTSLRHAMSEMEITGSTSNGKLSNYLTEIGLRSIKNNYLIETKFIVCPNLKCQVESENLVRYDASWSVIVVGDVFYPRRAVIAKINYNGSEFIVFEFEKFKEEQIRTIVLANTDFLPFEDDDLIELLFDELCKCNAIQYKIMGNEFFHGYRIKFINHKYELREIYMTLRILESISDKECFTLIDNRTEIV